MYTTDLFIRNNFDIYKVINVLKDTGALSFPFLRDPFRQLLLEEARTFVYRKLKEYSGGARVRQQIWSSADCNSSATFQVLKSEFSLFLSHELRQLQWTPFSPPLYLNHARVQKYEKGSMGITPHVDGKSFRNIACLFMIHGDADFFVCRSRAGANATQICTTPGNLILMRANGFLSAENTPFHYLANVRSERFIFSFRQRLSLEG